MNYKQCKEHKKPRVIKWGISGSSSWCEQCKKFIPHKIDWSGHP
jgi:hypothetical protein